jgi:hypothetical protein
MIYFSDIPNNNLDKFKESILCGERPSIAMRQLYDSLGIESLDQVALSTPVDILSWGIANLDIEAISGHVIDSGCPFFDNEQESSEFDRLIAEWVSD